MTVWLHLEKKYNPSNKQTYEEAETRKLEQYEVHIFYDQKMQLEQAIKGLREQEENGSYCYINLWENDIEASQVEVKDREQGSDELMVGDSNDNVVKKENQEDEKVEEFLAQPRDDDKYVDKLDNLDSVFEDDHEKFPVEPRQDCDTVDDSDSDVRRDDVHVKMVVIESETDEPFKDRDEYLFGEEENLKDDIWNKEESSMWKKASPEDDVENEEKCLRAKEESLMDNAEYDEKCSVGKENILMEEDKDDIFAVYISRKETESFIKKSIKNGKEKEEIQMEKKEANFVYVYVRKMKDTMKKNKVKETQGRNDKLMLTELEQQIVFEGRREAVNRFKEKAKE